MPFYQVHHSLPLGSKKRQAIANAITNLHCAAFNTPSFFVHVRFIFENGSDGAYFVAGKLRPNKSNSIVGVIRTSPSRSKEDFDNLGEQIEKSWYDAVGGSIEDKDKRLSMVMFTPMVAIREGGMAIPEAGHEGQWLEDKMPYFREMSEKGIKDFTEMLTELEGREDLKSLQQ
jgi:phenylpyruvate tautomerase PptA (4-oxalocrotonate tautomerase family)